MFHLFIFVIMILVVQNAQSGDKSNKKMNSKELNEDLQISTKIFNSCIIISYNYLTQEDAKIENELNTIMGAYEDINLLEERLTQQLIASKRIKLEAVKHCVNKQSIQGAQKMLEELQNRKFEAKNYYHMMNEFELKKFYNRKIQHKFTNDENTLSQMIEEFLQKLREVQGIPELGLNDLYPQIQDDGSKIKMVAIESSWLSYMVLFSVASVIILIMKYAYSTLQDSQKKNSKKQKN